MWDENKVDQEHASTVCSPGTPLSHCRRIQLLFVSTLGSLVLAGLCCWWVLPAVCSCFYLSATTEAEIPLLASWALAYVMKHLLKSKCLKHIASLHRVDQASSFTLTAPGCCKQTSLKGFFQMLPLDLESADIATLRSTSVVGLGQDQHQGDVLSKQGTDIVYACASLWHYRGVEGAMVV